MRQDNNLAHAKVPKSRSTSSSKKTQSKRMSISLSADIAKLLEELSNSQGVSQNEILRRAITTEAYIQKEIANGSTILIQKADGSIREVIFR